ncbi:MFS transporter [Sulfoacidibacillus thermotolerans]|uniref:Major facilitator superfamily (MFS) profile domain-containing protein n=1 Tax=Sulfoacidibacillus thermotolerans TaxID=1765684 RepID=A0A2U3D7F4_SULT2|nr:MFS transporter [Sulfoacidibacillus thermotolerans]PWI57214.1 hypothetical protein BM613_09480 [Sulfoacidibacillus thermotolerans]
MTRRQLWLAFSFVTTATFMVNVDSSIVNVALPTLSHQFHLSVASLQWVVTMYLLVITAILPIVAKLADVFGRRRIFVIGLMIFSLSSLFCGLSPNFPDLVAARGLQGVGGAIMQANVMSIVTLMFPVEMRGRALGTIGSVVAAGTLMGPILGGLLISWFGWPSIFYVNVPIGILGVAGILRYVPEFPGKPLQRSFDLLGGVLFAAFVVSFLTLFADLSHAAVSYKDGALTIVTALLLYAFIRVESRHPEPLVELSVFKRPLFSAAMGAGLLYWILMLFPAFLMPLYLQEVLHLPVWEIGLLMTPQSIAMLVISPIGGYLSDRYGTVGPAALGIGLFVAADIWFASLGTHASLLSAIGALTLQGIAAGMFSSPNNAEIFNRADKEMTGIVGGLIASERNFGRSLGVTFAALALSLGMQLFSGTRVKSAEMGVLPSHVFVTGFDFAFWIAVCVALLAMMFVFYPRLRRDKGLREVAMIKGE